jgi:hypothetical protein
VVSRLAREHFGLCGRMGTLRLAQARGLRPTRGRTRFDRSGARDLGSVGDRLVGLGDGPIGPSP